MSDVAPKKPLVGRRLDKLDLVRRASASDVRVSPRVQGVSLPRVKVIAASRGNGR